MRGFPTIRIVAGVLTLLINAAFGLFLLRDYLQYGRNVHPEPYHAPAVLAEFGTTALAVFMIIVTVLVELIRRDRPAAVTQVRFELAWIGVVVFLQYSSAVVFTTLYWFAFHCRDARQSRTCHTTNMITFISSLAIPFTTLCYFIFFLAIAHRAASRDPAQHVWCTPIRDVDWDGRRRTLVYASSIASFSNKEEAIMTLKSNPTYTIELTPRPDPNALKLNMDFTHNGGISPPRPAVLATVPEDELDPVQSDGNASLRSFTPKPRRMMQTIRQSLSPTVRSESVYSTADSSPTASRVIIPQIIRTSASTLANSMQSPVMALSKVKYFQATR
ncbi:hypothetical protein BKA62DRAFT_692466 [Auriculariales sp. MPI-PUGE-AT-0066]|nr:hypothetical protein BKA62DRAFT_692466 [Auriculariales sp. MPI-PUGE-AT-0066]